MSAIVFRRNKERANGQGFTLVELLVVIGIIALLISILLPALSKARESSNRVACLSNIKQVGLSFVMYVNDNKGYLPFAAPNNKLSVEDWVWWQADTTAGVNINRGGFSRIDEGGIGPFLNLSKTNTKVMICPSDDVSLRSRTPTGGKYPLSYALNVFMCSTPTTPSTASIQVYKLGRVRYAAQKVLLFEEDQATIDDGNGTVYVAKGSAGANLIALRHDRGALKTTDIPTTTTEVPNSAGKGTVVFCDGHADVVSRAYAASKRHTAPDADSVPWASMTDLFPND